MRLRCSPEVEAAIYRQGLVHDGFGRLGDVRCPVVVGKGGRSLAVEPEVARTQVDALPDATLVTFPELGHFGPLEDPAGVAARVLEVVAPPR